MVAIHLKDKPIQPNPKKDGEGHDRCPVDGCIEVDSSWRTGGHSQRHGRKDAEYLHWEVFSADPRKGGCGVPWTRTTSQGKAQRDARGLPTGMLTRAAQAGRVMSVPSEAYRANWARAFGKEE